MIKGALSVIKDRQQKIRYVANRLGEQEAKKNEELRNADVTYVRLQKQIEKIELQLAPMKKKRDELYRKYSTSSWELGRKMEKNISAKLEDARLAAVMDRKEQFEKHIRECDALLSKVKL